MADYRRRADLADLADLAAASVSGPGGGRPVVARLMLSGRLVLVVALMFGSLVGCSSDPDEVVTSRGDEASEEPPAEERADVEPDDEPSTPVAVEQVLPLNVVKVAPGDTLAGIVTAECGGELDLGLVAANFERNRDVLQPDGGRLTDPGRIEIGWQLEVDCTLEDVRDPREPGQCPDELELAVAGRTEDRADGQFFDVTICVRDTGVGDYHAVDRFGAEIRLPVCALADEADVLHATNQGYTYVVETGVIETGSAGRLRVLDPDGVEILALEFAELETGAGTVAECEPPTLTYPIVELPDNRIRLAAEGLGQYPPQGLCPGRVDQVLAFTDGPGDLPDGPLFVEQGFWLWFAVPEVWSGPVVSLVGGGHAWVLEAELVQGSWWYRLDITAEHPQGVYTLAGDLHESKVREVIIEPSSWLNSNIVESDPGVFSQLVYGVGESEQVRIAREVWADCVPGWELWQPAVPVEVNAESNTTISIELTAAPDGVYCLYFDGYNPDSYCNGPNLFHVGAPG